MARNKEKDGEEKWLLFSAYISYMEGKSFIQFSGFFLHKIRRFRYPVVHNNQVHCCYKEHDVI